MKGLRKWLWGELPDYNGFTHPERVRGWQLVMWQIDNGWSARGATCCISGQTHQLRLHSEIYYDWRPYAITHTLHMALHRRFKEPDAWRRIIDRYSKTGDEWFARLLLVPVDFAAELRKEHGPEIADIFARAPIPAGVTVPVHDIYGAE